MRLELQRLCRDLARPHHSGLRDGFVARTATAASCLLDSGKPRTRANFCRPQPLDVERLQFNDSGSWPKERTTRITPDWKATTVTIDRPAAETTSTPI